MKLGKNATLLGAALFVVAASIFVGTIDVDPLPVEVSNTLELRQALFLCRTMPPPGVIDGTGAEKSPGGSNAGKDEASALTTDLAVGMLEKLAGKPLDSAEDHLAGAAASAWLGARHLVPLFAGAATSTDPAARVLVNWSFDPTYIPTAADINVLRAMKARDHAVDMAVASVAPRSWYMPERDLTLWHWELFTWAGGAVLVVGIALLVWGMVSWFVFRRIQIAAARPERPGIDAASMRGPLEVYIWFTALFLAVNILVPPRLEPFGLSMPVQIVIVYLITGIGGFIIASRFGRTSEDSDWLAVLGVSHRRVSRPGPFGPARPMLDGLRGYAMIWPALLTATFIGGLFGDAGSAMDNPMALFLATRPAVSDRVILLVSVGILAPLFEEPLFRGFFYRRFRASMTPYGAAAASGFIFAAAHFSQSGFLPIWAIGFTLGLTYESSSGPGAPRLRSSMVAHALWNLGTAGAILLMYG